MILKNLQKKLRTYGMAITEKVTKKQLLKFLLSHPIKSSKSLISLKKASDIELVAVWYWSSKELKKRGIK